MAYLVFLKARLRSIGSRRIVAVLVLAGTLCAVVVFDVVSVTRERYAVRECATISDQEDRFQCWFDIIRDYIKQDEIERAFRVFKYTYDTQPIFAETGCHIHAHKVGDMQYYERYRERATSFDELRFPQETTTCGYGFYHGFFEHLVQENPTASFISDTCAYFGERLGGSMASIVSTCFHGSGHGLMLAEGLKHGKSDWGKAEAYTRPALLICDSLRNARDFDMRECREGVYNVLVNWMAGNEYGFTLKPNRLFDVCKNITRPEWKKACYYELSQKLDTPSESNITKLQKIVRDIPETELRYLAFSVGVNSIMQSRVGDGEYAEIVAQCDALTDVEYKKRCVQSVVAGLFEHGSTQEEYKPAFTLCRTYQGDLAKACWQTTGGRLARFYGLRRAKELCADVPVEFQEICFSTARDSI
ncbi:hypothetical protein EBR66_06245 [bacterium]|nr:hypothetical protein [bacterium]